MTAPAGFCVSTSEFPVTLNSYWFPAPPMANALFATAAFVASLFPVTVYVPVLRYSALNTATLSASVALSFDG